MSCNGCRILRKGCNENCILRQSLQGIESPQAQANATLFVAKFFGRAGLMSFLLSVPESQRPALFQSLLFEACGRTVNPVTGAVGLMWTKSWDTCQSAVETVLRGGVLRPLPEFVNGSELANNDDLLYESREMNMRLKRKSGCDVNDGTNGMDLSLTAGFTARMTAGGRVNRRCEKRRLASPSDDQSDTTTLESGFACQQDLQQISYNGHDQTKLLKLFF